MNILEWIEKEKYYLVSTKDGKKWCSTKNRGDYSKPAPIYIHEQLIEKYENSKK